ncbi:hypothetical protein BDW59DRAFT_145781 [Aspergillus cavernicola]|uniref:non-specific serine/threonine protein kinase n=1 Tax=Aspergillus cavernicola TaxID=176166 RepID=A0ABR4IDM0_9EURO
MKVGPILDILAAAFLLISTTLFNPRSLPSTNFCSAIRAWPHTPHHHHQHSEPTQTAEMPPAEAQNERYESVLKDINGSIYGSVKGFYEKYFENKPWSTKAEQISRTVSQAEVDEWSLFAPSPGHHSFLERFSHFQSKLLDGRNAFHILLGQSPGDQQLPNLFLAPTSPREDSRDYSWTDVLVIGEVSQGQETCQQQFLHLCGHAQKVFTSQPTRRFLHCFYVCGSVVEFWVFDRSGPYSCKAFDIYQHPDRFIIALAGYTEMNDEELGLNTFIKSDDHGRYILLQSDQSKNQAKTERLYLEDQPVAFAPDLVCTGTTAYRAKYLESREWNFVAKFTWRADNGKREEDMLRLIKKKGVWGVVQLFGVHDLDSITNLRRGLEFNRPRSFPSTLDEIPSPTDTGSLAELAHHPRGVVDRYTIEASLADEIVEEGPLFPNRLFVCIAVHPPGRAMDEFKSIPEFLGAFIDIIKGLRSLYKEGRILHQDVSKNNLMISDVRKEGDPRGFLIDLDAAKLLDDPNAKDELTGTRLFMAIGVLKARAHTYRHDLESLFYCLLWIASTYGREGLPKDSNFYGWVLGSFDDCANNKSKDMRESEFEQILSNFSPEFTALAALARELRIIMFPNQDGSLFMGSDGETASKDVVYDRMIDAFDRVLASYGRSGESVKI